MTRTSFVLGLLAVATIGLTACSDSGNPASPSAAAALSAPGSASTPAPGGGSSTTSQPGEGGGGGGSTPGSGAGTLSVMMTDSPFSDALAVLVTISEVSVHRTGASWESLPMEGGAITCDLKKLEGPVDFLAGGTLEAGKYTQIRLTVASAGIYFENALAGADACAPAADVIEPDGLSGTVRVPSGVIHLNRPFTLAAGGATAILLDFDGDESIRREGNPNATCEVEAPAPAGAGRGGGNGNGNGGGNGGGNGNGGADGCEFRMNPVISVVSVEETG